MLNHSEIIFVIGKTQSAGIAEAMVSICNDVYLWVKMKTTCISTDAQKTTKISGTRKKAGCGSKMLMVTGRHRLMN